MKLFQVDSFTNEPFSGNPAGVCLMTEPRDDTWLQAVAREMNLSETAFLSSNGGRYDLRWFTPTIEVDLCGHATLASAHILWETTAVTDSEPIHFDTRSGTLTAIRAGDWIELDFPATPEEPADSNIDLGRALGVSPTYIGRSEYDFLVEVASEKVLGELTPDFVLLERATARGIIVTAQAVRQEYDFVSRFFAPQSGVNEDPVTGSSHCCLAPYWSKRLGRTELIGYQASERGGIVRTRLEGQRVILGGQAVTIFDAELV